MKRGAGIALLGAISILVNLGFVIASCPAGQMANFDGSCIGDPNYNAGAVSCASLMASSGKSAETLCKVNYASQCCGQAADSSNAQASSAASSDATTYPSGYKPLDCTTRDNNIVEGLCPFRNQFGDLDRQVSNFMATDIGRTAEAQKLHDAYNADIEAYRVKAYAKQDGEIDDDFQACLDARTDPYKTDDNCYPDWKKAYAAVAIDLEKYRINAAKKLLIDLKALSSSNTKDNTDSARGSPLPQDQASQGGFNTNSDRGLGGDGRINPSIEGYLGDAYVIRSDGTKVIPGKEIYLNVKDSVVSGKNSNINIIFSDAGRINLGPNTEMRVGNALLDQFYLARGSLKSQINWGTLPPQKLEFHTPNAAVYVKGTEFIMDYNETSNITTIYLYEGFLEIDTGERAGNLTAGNYLIIYSNGSGWTGPLQPEKWNSLGENFYDIADVGGFFKGFLIIMIIIDIAGMVFFNFLLKRKIKSPNKKDKSISNGTTSLVLGILGIILVVAPYIGVILSSAAYYYSRIQKASNPTKLATAGFVLGIIGLILNIIVLIIIFISTL